MAKQLMPRAELEPRDSDLRLSDEQFSRLSLFAQLKRKPTLDKFPGTMVLRRYAKGEVICRQGEAGWTAFYILTTADVLALREAQLQALPAGAGDNERKALEYEVTVLRQRAERLKDAPADDELRTAATVYLAVARDKPKPPSGLGRLFHFGRKADRPARGPDDKALYIPIDAPVAVDYETLRAPLEEGELFGEMSCLYRTPRSGTIVARRDVYVIELLRNILDQIQKDPAYKARTDEVYKKRVLDLQLRKLSIFSDLTDAEFDLVRQGVELVSVAPGTLICDENERSDSFYVVRSGLVKVLKGQSSLLHPDDVIDWNALCAGLVEGEAQPATPKGKLWQLLPPRVQAIVRAAAPPAALNGPDRAEVVHALNDVIKSPPADAKELQPVIEAAPLREQTAELLAERARLKAKKGDWTAEDARRFGRLLLQALLPAALRPLPKQAGPEVVLSYCSRGDFFGEMGLMLGQPRSATCVAFGQPNDMGQVELVRVPGRVFAKLIAAAPAARAKVEQEVAKRRQQTAKRLATPAWDDGRDAQFSDRFQELGLIQGQRLMLIDLDRCTRCDECVKACVNTHDDGRTRLFLDGPRFGKYLVPTTCRSCLDPVCMIGCPVGSIHRGDNGQIIIEDWCIGCNLCADNCPYGSIQMHDLGVLAEHDRGWRFLPAARVSGDKWQRPGFRDGAWLCGESPFRLDRDLKDRLGGQAGPVDFRHEFELTKEQVRGEAQFKVEVVSLAPTLTVWLNGQELTADGKPKRDGRREYTLPQKRVVNGAATEELIRPHAGANVLAAQAAPTANATEVLFQLRLDAVRRPEGPAEGDEVTEKLVTTRAVVCDLCSAQYGQVPACVNACPHDAAMRVNARFEFPVR
ncbi:MAG TPA: cyclic nucleotide-binding domain-containing protein [Gemmataceae bacterium]|nr:cyclic nucleotide-binding domain-containing protein [Gemmataceae bacterium]